MTHPIQAHDSERVVRDLSQPAKQNPLSIRERILAKRFDVKGTETGRISSKDSYRLAAEYNINVRARGPWLAPIKKRSQVECDWYETLLAPQDLILDRAARREANLTRLGHSLNSKGRPWRLAPFIIPKKEKK